MDENMIPTPAAEEQLPEETVVAPEEPVAEIEETKLPDEQIPAPTAAPAPQSKLKSLMKKWWFWVIAVAVVALIVVGVVAITDSGSSNGSYSSTVYENPYVTLVKTTTNSTYGITYGRAFDSFFTNPHWEYFTATTGEHVVEFEGGFLYDGSPATATIQFVLDMDEGMLEVYHLSINGVGQNRLMLSAMIEKVFESY